MSSNYYKDHPTPYEEDLAMQFQRELEKAVSSLNNAEQELKTILKRIDFFNRLQANWRWN